MKKTTIVIATLMISTPAWAQTTAQQGLDRLQTNFANSKSNLEDYRKNLKITEGNLSEVTKAKSQVEAQDKDVAKTAEENQKNLAAVQSREGELNQLIQEEQKQIAVEESKVQELEKLTTALRDNQKKRQANIQNYDEQKRQIASEKKEWQARQDQIAKTQAQVKSKLTTLNSQESEWKNKKRGYEGEVGRWQKEVDREKKLVDTYQSLSEVKD